MTKAHSLQSKLQNATSKTHMAPTVLQQQMRVFNKRNRSKRMMQIKENGKEESTIR